MAAEIYLLLMIIAIVVTGSLIYFCCVELETREKKNFRHTSSVMRELEAGTLSGDAAATNQSEAGNKPRKGVKGESFYRGKDTLLKEKEGDGGDEDFLGQALYGLPEEDEFHLGKDHVLE